MPASVIPAPVIRLHEVSLGYNRQKCAISGLSGEFASGSLTAVVGANGTGKSTLLKTLVGQLKPLAGHFNCDIRTSNIGYLAQLDQIDRSFPMTVCDFVALGTWNRAGWWRSLSGKASMEITLDAIEAVGLRGLEGRWIGELSGGQFQRVRFARLLVQQAPLILLDEPFSGVDTQTTGDLLCLIHQWHQQGRTVIAVLHDMALVRRHFPCTLALAPPPAAPLWGDTADVLGQGMHCRIADVAEVGATVTDVSDKGAIE